MRQRDPIYITIADASGEDDEWRSCTAGSCLVQLLAPAGIPFTILRF